MNKKYHVISNTHWDREWRYPFQRNRQMLVEMIDEVLKILEDHPDYRAFHLDSQSIVLDDYLQIRPDKQNAINEFVEKNRLLIGPWYILPDEFLVGGENLIRNLLLGHKTCKRFGRVSKIGYSPFSWGQISQLPQIYRGFNISLIMFYRGVNSLDSDKAEFIWEGADGTRSLASRFSTMPRYNFYFYIYRPVIHNEDPYTIEHKWSKEGTLFHFASSPLYDEDYYIINEPDTFYEENIVPWVKKLSDLQDNDFTTENVIWMEGHDSSGPNAKTVRIIEDIKRLIPGIDLLHSTLEDYQEALQNSVDTSKLPLVKGERRSAQYDKRSGNLYGHVISSRTYLKMANFNSERWLQYYAEPFNSLAGVFGMDINDGYLDLAWNYLIQNSAHDSIGGCSRDSIHADMIWRYKQIDEISTGVFSRSIKHLLLNTNTAPLKNKHDLYITVVNPSFVPRDGVEKVVIDIPEEFDKGAFTLVDESGNEIPFQLLSVNDSQPVLESLKNRPMYLQMKRYTGLVKVSGIPSFGLRTLSVVPKNRFTQIKVKGKVRLSIEKRIIENDFYKLKFNKNGTFNILDKKSGKRFNYLGYFYDEGESGNAWVHKSESPIITTLNSRPEFSNFSSGELKCSITVSHKIKVPQNRLISFKKKDAIKQRILLTVELTANSSCISLYVSYDNQILNHRLRIMFPANLAAKYSFAEGGFDITKRATERQETENWVEQPQYDYPFHQFVCIQNESKGLAVFGNGLKEYEVLNDKKQTLAITLLKGFTYKIAPSSQQDYSHENGSQVLGPFDCKLGLYFIDTGGTDSKLITDNVYNAALNFHNPLHLIQHGKTGGTLPLSVSFISFKSLTIKVSAFKISEDGMGFILRIYNPSEDTLNEQIRFAFPVKTISEVNLEEINENALSFSDGTLDISIPSKKIKTLKICIK